MFKHKYIAARVDRHTYLKGRFKGKFVGKLDLSSSDPRQERFYDLEIMEGEIETRQDDLVSWTEKKEPEEFSEQTIFPTHLPGKINVTLHCLNGEVKHFKIALKQIKLKDCHLSGQTYGKNEVFGNIEGLICGYVLHHDMLVKEIVEEPQITKPPKSHEQENQNVKKQTTTAKPREPIIVEEPPANRTRFLQIFGGLLGLGLLIAALIIVKNLVFTLLGLSGIGLTIRWLNRWTGRRYGSRISRSITTFAIIVTSISFLFYLSIHYQNYALYNTSNENINPGKLKDSAAQFLTQNRYNDALKVYNQLLETNSDDKNSRYQRALCYSRVGRIVEAVEDLRSLISKGDSAAVALHDRINPIKRRKISVIRCNDGTISHSKNRRGTCSHHGGVKNWNEEVSEEYRDY